jgi:hypothetical protein
MWSFGRAFGVEPPPRLTPILHGGSPADVQKFLDIVNGHGGPHAQLPQ